MEKVQFRPILLKQHLGFIKSETQIAQFLNIADSVSFATCEDNLSKYYHESLACGTPVISTDVGGISDMVTDNYNGRLIERDNAEQMADAILQSIEDETLPPLDGPLTPELQQR